VKNNLIDIIKENKLVSLPVKIIVIVWGVFLFVSFTASELSFFASRLMPFLKLIGL
jgi:DNA integrity scanning protein DisA with diadenylate cyclase activity